MARQQPNSSDVAVSGTVLTLRKELVADTRSLVHLDIGIRTVDVMLGGDAVGDRSSPEPRWSYRSQAPEAACRMPTPGPQQHDRALRYCPTR